MTTESLENVGLDGYVGEESPLSMYELIACFHEFCNYEYVHRYVYEKKNHEIFVVYFSTMFNFLIINQKRHLQPLKRN